MSKGDFFFLFFCFKEEDPLAQTVVLECYVLKLEVLGGQQCCIDPEVLEKWEKEHFMRGWNSRLSLVVGMVLYIFQ